MKTRKDFTYLAVGSIMGLGIGLSSQAFLSCETVRISTAQGFWKKQRNGPTGVGCVSLF